MITMHASVKHITNTYFYFLSIQKGFGNNNKKKAGQKCSKLILFFFPHSFLLIKIILSFLEPFSISELFPFKNIWIALFLLLEGMIV